MGEFCALWLAAALTLALLAAALPGFQLQASDETGIAELLGRAVLIAWAFGLLNALFWPLLMRALLRMSALLVLGALFVVNGSLMLVALRLVPEAEVTYLPDALLISLVLSTVTSLISGAMAARKNTSYQLMLVRRARRAAAPTEAATPGLLCLQLDGLGHDVLRRALDRGDVPHLGALLTAGRHRLQAWHTDWSSQTGAAQLGILHGDNVHVPAFRWYEKDPEVPGAGRVMAVSSPSCTDELEHRVDRGRALLSEHGASFGNLFTGGAEQLSLVVSTLRHSRGMRSRAGYGAYFVDPANTVRTSLRFVAEVVRELAQGARRRGPGPRVRRGGLYPFVRAFATVVETDVVVAAVAGALLAGRDVIYADLVGYDEVAHHSGVEHPETMAVLRRLDAEIGLLLSVAAGAPRRYELVVLSDHGQSPGQSFRSRYSETLADVVRHACQPAGAETGVGVAVGRGVGRGAEARAVATQTVRPQPAPPVRVTHEPVVLCSGNLGLVSFPDLAGRATLEDVAAHHPRLIERLRAHPGVGFVLVARAAGGSVVLGPHGSVDVDTGRVHGADPLASLGADALTVIRRSDTFPHVADLMINGAWDAGTGEVVGFEEQMGSHGGLGGPQSKPFLLYPVALPAPPAHLLGAVAVHDVLRDWLAHLTPGTSAAASLPDPSRAATLS